MPLDIYESFRGCQYTSYAFGKRCREAGVMPSMGSTGDAYDNAMAESFFATLEREVLNRRRFQSQTEARMAIFQLAGGLVQSPSSPLRPRLSITHQLREEATPRDRLKPKLIPVHGSGSGPNKAVEERLVLLTDAELPLLSGLHHRRVL